MLQTKTAPLDAPVDYLTSSENSVVTEGVAVDHVLYEQLPNSQTTQIDFVVNFWEAKRSVLARVLTEEDSSVELDFDRDPSLRLANLVKGPDEERIRTLVAAGVMNARVLVNMFDNPDDEDERTRRVFVRNRGKFRFLIQYGLVGRKYNYR